MSVDACADNLQLAVRHALLTTRTTAVCPFHTDVTIRIGETPPRPMPFIVPETSSQRHRVESCSSDGREPQFGLVAFDLILIKTQYSTPDNK